MKKFVFPLILIVILVTLAHLRRPDLDAHRARLLAHAALLKGQTGFPAPAGLLPLELRDYFVVTLTRDPATGGLVSFGFGHYIKVLDNDWGARALTLSPSPVPR